MNRSSVRFRQAAQILADFYQTGDVRDRDLWREYGRITRGLAAVRWSRGLRAIMLGPTAVPERTDEELAAEDVSGELVTVITVPAWSRIRRVGLDHAVLVAAEHGGFEGVSALIGQLAVGDLII